MKSIIAGLAGIGVATLAGCTTAQPQSSAAQAPAPTVTITVTTTAEPPSPTAQGTPAAASPAATAAGTSLPVLGQPAGVFAHGEGFGQAQPARIFNGGDPTGLVTQIVWKSWGGARAVATGVSEWAGAGQSVATGTPEPVRVVAFHLGSCGGQLMYQAVEWYFPQHGQAFTPGRYENICTGSYVPAQ
jgi:hypothetical protein